MITIKNLATTGALGRSKKKVVGIPEDALTQENLDSFNNDPFGIYEAIRRAKEPKSIRQRVLATGIRYCFLSSILIPPIVFLWLIYFGVKTNWTAFSVILLLSYSLWIIGFIVQQLRLLDCLFAKDIDTNLTDDATHEKIAVVGAGPVGLTVVKECSALGLNVTCFESNNGVGGVFRYDDKNPGGVWKNLVLTTSPWITAFSDFPPKDTSCQHWRHDEYLDYLERYVDHFCLRDKILLNHKVTKVKKLEQGWELQIVNLKTMHNITQHFDRVVVCNGLNSYPKQFDVPGIEKFNGEILSAAHYKTPDQFHGKRVCIVGLG